MRKNKWFPYTNHRETARYRLFCLPYAGGSALFYSDWHKWMPEEIEIVPVQIPGREGRIGESCISEARQLAQQIVEAVKALPGQLPYGIFGHSMGGILAYETAAQLEREDFDKPRHLFISGCTEPSQIRFKEKTYNLSDADFCEKIKGYDDIEEEIFSYKEFYKYFLPMLRADFGLVETYQEQETAVFPCPLVLIGGDADPSVPVEDLTEWERHAGGNFHVEVYKGNHFYLKEHKKELCAMLGRRILREEPGREVPQKGRRVQIEA